MNYEEYKSHCEAFADRLGTRTETEKALDRYNALRMQHRWFAPDEKSLKLPCRESYGWCWVHMAKALPPEPVVSVGGFQIGRSNELEIDLRDVDPEVMRALTERPAGRGFTEGETGG